jgi:hypothetical protein
LDDVLIALKTGNSRPNDPARQRLVALFEELSKGHPHDSSAQVLLAVSRDNMPSRTVRWEQLATGLRQEDVAEDTVRQLDSLAQAIEVQRAGTMAHMRGWTR